MSPVERGGAGGKHFFVREPSSDRSEEFIAANIARLEQEAKLVKQHIKHIEEELNLYVQQTEADTELDDLTKEKMISMRHENAEVFLVPARMELAHYEEVISREKSLLGKKGG